MPRHAQRSAGETRAEDQLSRRVSVALEEYRALRDEIVASLSMQQAVLSFSTLALGGLALAGFRALGTDGDDAVALVIFLLAVPVVSYVSLLIWLGEYARTTRAGRFLSELEHRINTWVGYETLTWEQFLRKRDRGRYPQYSWNVWAMFLFYAALPLGSLGVAASPGDFGERWLVLVYVGEVALWFLLVSFSGRVFLSALDDSQGRDANAGAPSPAGGIRARRRLTAPRIRPA
jgi:hypothetical protein